MTNPSIGGLSTRFRTRLSEIRPFFLTLSKLVAGLGLAAVTTSAGTTAVPGYLSYEYFPGYARTDVEAGTAKSTPPYAIGVDVGTDGNALINTFESGTNFADNYANRISGLFSPPTTGNYVFFVASDDDGDLFLSTDATPANKKLIAQEAGWSGVRKYTTVGGGSTLEDKRSDSFTKSQWPGGTTIKLTKGQQYYIEYVHHEGGGGDNVAVTYKLDTDADPADGDAPAFTKDQISAIVNTGTPTITLQPVGGTAYVGAPFSMFVVDGSNGQFPVGIQWRKDGTNIPGAVKATYSIGAATAADAGKYDVVLSAYQANGSTTSITSAPPSVVTVKTVPIGFATGKLKYEYFPGSVRADVEGGTAPANTGGSVVGSDKDGFISSAESGTNFADNYANRISGYFIPPTNGNYIFYIASDDDGDLFLSTDETPANKKLIAQESGWSGVRNYQGVGGGSQADDKKSDTFSGSEWPSGGASITLTAGKKYYIEAVHHEGGGGDNLAVTYRLDSEPASLIGDGTAPRLAGAVIGADNVPSILGIKFVDLTDKRMTFTVGDVGVSKLDPATTKVTFDGQASGGTLTSSASGGVTTYTYTFATPLPYNSSHLYRIDATDVLGNAVAISGSASVGAPYFPTADLPGQKAVDGAWAYEFIYGIQDANSNLIQVTGLQKIMGLIQSSTNSNFIGKIVKGTSPIINWHSGGFLADDIPYPDDAVNDTPAWTGDDFINLNVANLNVTEEGDYTFGVHSDDGMAMRIRGATAISAGGSGQLDPYDPEAVVEPADTGDSNTKGTWHLKKGIYRMEFFWWERGGGDYGEIYVAKGVFKTDADTDTWKAVGDPAFTSITLTSQAPTTGGNPGGPTPKALITITGNTIKVDSDNGGTVQVASSLSAPITWTDVGPAPQNVTISGAGFKFYRIKK